MPCSPAFGAAFPIGCSTQCCSNQCRTSFSTECRSKSRSTAGLMDPELPGYENVFYAGGLIGIPRNRLRKLMPDIESFAELGDFLRMPVRTYSAGMKVRLGFAVATCIEPDILLMDEVIGAGDAHFVDKAVRRAQQLYKQSNILVVASHYPDPLHRLCN